MEERTGMEERRTGMTDRTGMRRGEQAQKTEEQTPV